MNALADNLEEYPDRVQKELQARRARRQDSRGSKDDESEISFVMVDEQTGRRKSDEVMEDECQILKKQSEEACRQIGQGYDALIKFVKEKPHGTYQEFIEYLLHIKASNTDDNETIDLTEEDLYAKNSHIRNLWNDNLTLGLDGPGCTTLDGRAFVAARDQAINECSTQDLGNLRPRALSGDRLKQISQIDRQKIASSAFNVLSNVSSLAMKPLRDLQMAEKVNAMQLDIEEEEARREIERYHLREEEKRDLEEMMQLKKEAEERTLTLTKEHLVEFLEKYPDASYTEWIEDLVRTSLHGMPS